MPVEYGLERTDVNHAISLTSVSDGVLTASSVKTGRRVSNSWDLVINPAPTALPSTAKLRQGFALDANDCIYATQTEPTTKLYSFGIATRLDGTVWFTTTYTAGQMKEIFHPLIGFGLVNQTGALYAGGFVGIPFDDSGSGAVNTDGFLAGSPTFTRATEAACRLSTGLWKLDVASGVARSHYHEFAAGVYTYGGYLAEPAATQLALLPRDMTNAAWTKGATITVAQTGTGIDGVSNSCTRVTAGAVEATNTVLQTLTAAASSRTYSAFIKRVTGTGTVAITQDGVSYTDVTSQLNTTSFVQVQLNASQLNASFGVRVSTNGDVILVDCNQFEAGALATTPIPAAGTRNADVLKYTTQPDFGAVGTLYAECVAYGAASFGRFVEVSDGTTNEEAYIGFNTNMGIGIIRDGGALQANFSVALAVNTLGKMAMAYATNSANYAMNGTLGTQDTSCTMPTTTEIDVGCNGASTSQPYGTIKNVRIWTVQRNDLVSMTA